MLRDGAAAQYGSDAIAGVINFHLRSARNGGRASVTYGQYYTHVDDIQTYDGVVIMRVILLSSRPTATLTPASSR